MSLAALGGGGAALSQQLKMMQQLSEAQQKVTSFFGGGDVDEEAERKAAAEKEEAEQKAMTAESSTKYLFRLCVYSGEDLPRDNAYVRVCITDEEGNVKVHKSASSASSAHPVWEYFFEDEIYVSNVNGPPRVELQIYGQRVMHEAFDKYVGTTLLKLPTAGASPGPMRAVLPLQLNTWDNAGEKIAETFRDAKNPRLVVVWQVCDENQLVPDLIRIAEMDEDADQRANYQFHLKLVSAELRRPTEGPRKISANFRLIAPTGEAVKHAPPNTSHLASTVPIERLQEAFEGRLKEEDIADEVCGQAVWSQDHRLGWEMPRWFLRESRLSLLSYTVEATLFIHGQSPPAEGEKKKGLFSRAASAVREDKPIKVGTWRETLGEILESIEESDGGLVCDASIESKEGAHIASLRLEIDLFSAQAHRMPPSLVASNPPKFPLTKAPARKGVPPQEIWHTKMQYYCTVMCDSLPNNETCLPYVRITMGSSVEQTEAKDVHSVYNVLYDRPLPIQTTLINRKAKIEICSKPSGVLSADSERVIGEGVVYDITPDKEYYIHCTGGALDAPNKDVAMQMVKGALRPASTYTGTVAVKFGGKMSTKAKFDSFYKKRQNCRLQVKLYSGLNLTSFAGKKVSVVIKVAACRLPNRAGAVHIIETDKKIKELHEKLHKKEIKKNEMSRQIAELEASRISNPDYFNNNLLSFPAEVDEMGVLHFVDHRDRNKRLAWVERTTPKDWPLSAYPNVQHAYVYIVVNGEETEPPTVYGRMRLGSQPLHEEMEGTVKEKDVPKWKRMRYDISVVNLPTAHFKSDFAGFMLGSAALIAAPGDESQPNQPLSALSPESIEVLMETSCNAGCFGPTDIQEMLPDSSKKVWCGLSSAQVSRGSKGEIKEIRSQPQDPSRLSTVYCHVDVLAARELPAMDDDGLTDPSYSIDVKDKTLLYPTGTAKSLSPTFMHRVCIPIQMEVEKCPTSAEFPLMASAVPMPPVVLKILDRDDRKILSVNAGDMFEEIGTVVIKQAGKRIYRKSVIQGDTVNRLSSQRQALYSSDGLDVFPFLGFQEDQALLDNASGCMFAKSAQVEELDVNRLHQAKWHSIDKPAKAAFDATTGGVDPSWHKRPRVLVAAAYSMQGKVKEECVGKQLEVKTAGNGSECTLHKLTSHESASFQIDFSLLGLRNLPDNLSDMTLVGSSFWEGKLLELPVANTFGSSAKNYNFLADDDGEDPGSWQKFADEVAPLVRLHVAEKIVPGAKNSPPAPTPRDQITQESVAIKEIMGVKAIAPLYHVPVIPYLQQDSLKAGQWICTDKSKGEKITLEIAVNASEVTVKQVSGEKVDPSYSEDQTVSSYGSFDSAESLLQFGLYGCDWHGKVTNLGRTISKLTVTRTADESLADKHDETQVATYEAHWEEEAPFVLLPALTFQLKNNLTGADHGTLTVGMNRLAHTMGTLSRRPGAGETWMDICLREHKALPEELKVWTSEATAKAPARQGGIGPLKNLKVNEDAYEAFVDVFAYGTGFLYWDQSHAIGRVFQDHYLFSISDYPDKDSEDAAGKDKDETSFMQFFNPCDWISGDSRFVQEQFDERVWARFVCLSDYKDDGPRESLPEFKSRTSATPEQHAIAAATGAIEWLDKKEKAIYHDKPRPKHPLPPEELWANFFSSGKGRLPGQKAPRNANELRLMSTKEAARIMRSIGWRCPSHLAAPEQLPDAGGLMSSMMGGGKTAQKSKLKVNRHCFMRPVGHRIGECRDSRFLCRLKMEMPKHFVENQRAQLAKFKQILEEEVREHDDHQKKMKEEAARGQKIIIESLSKIDNSATNYLVIKFKLPGVVIWAAPESRKAFDKPGDLLFAVRLLANPDQIVPVMVPNMDLRQPKECAWTCQKALNCRFRHLEDKIEREKRKELIRTAADTAGKKKSPAAVEKAQEADNENPKKKKDEDETDSEDETNADGFHRRIAVTSDCFVMRIKRKHGGMMYDRSPANDWYRLVLAECFPEIEQQEKNDPSLVPKEFFFNKFMNLRRQLSLPSDRGETVIKGHINCKRVDDRKSIEEDKEQQELIEGLIPVENLWFSQTVYFTVNICTFAKMDFGGMLGDNSQVYFVVTNGADKVTGEVVKIEPGTRVTDVYQTFQFEASLPGSDSICIQAWKTSLLNLGGDECVGEIFVDAEDRWMALKRKEFRAGTNQQFLEDHISPTKQSRYFSVDPPDLVKWDPPQEPKKAPEGKGVDVRPSRTAGCRAPMESKLMKHMDEQTRAETRTLMLRFFVDMNANHPPEPIRAHKNHEFEVRVTVNSVENVRVYKDFGERNDLFVTMKYKSVAMDGTEQRVVEKTDIHKFAHTEASYNERFSFPLRGPSCAASIEFTLKDFDRVSASDIVYFSQTMSLDHIAMMAYENIMGDRPPLGPISKTIIFDDWPAENQIAQSARGCCGRARKLTIGDVEDKIKQTFYAKLYVQVEIVPLAHAVAHPAKTGVFAPPKDRMSMQFLASNPIKATKVMLGPTLFRTLQMGALGTGVLLTLIMVLTVLYFIVYFVGQSKQIAS